DPGMTDARLRGIDFPRMEVEDARLPVDTIDVAQAPARKRVGQQPEVASARRRQVPSEHLQRARRNLDDARWRLPGESWRLGHAIVIVRDRVDARAVAMAGFGEHVVRPQVAAADRETGRPVAGDGRTADV